MHRDNTFYQTISLQKRVRKIDSLASQSSSVFKVPLQSNGEVRHCDLNRENPRFLSCWLPKTLVARKVRREISLWPNHIFTPFRLHTTCLRASRYATVMRRLPYTNIHGKRIPLRSDPNLSHTGITVLMHIGKVARISECFFLKLPDKC